MIFKTCKIINFFKNSHSSVLKFKSTFEVLSTARFTSAIKPKQSENISNENVPIKDESKEVELKVTKVVGKDCIQNLKPYFNYKRPHTVGLSFTWDEECAKKIVKKVLGNGLNSDYVVLESHPGFGLTTVNFIESGIPKVYIFTGAFTGTKFYEKYCDKIETYQISIFQKHCLLQDTILNIIEEAVTSGKKCIIFGVITGHKFLSSLPRQIMNKNLWDFCDSIEFYTIVTDQVYTRITNYRATRTTFYIYCLFTCLFDVKLLETYPSSAFLPLLKTNAMHLVRIKKKSKRSLQISEELLPEYATFLKVLGSHKSNRIIQTLEKWVPGCGLKFISKGIRLTTEVKDISASEAILLFKFFTECEGYNNFKIMHNVLENEEKERKGK